jgi:pimeloyl-ACP methyl ester carboxylesterase
MPTVQANDITLYYEIHGEQHDETLLLINGVGQWHAAWWRNVEPLAEHFRVIAFDNRGIGDSDKPDIPYTLEMMADDALGLLDALAINRAHVLGHSMGGGIALFMARKAPERIASLILASTLYWGPTVAMPSPRAMQALQDRSGDPLELVKRGISIACAEGFEARDPEGFQKLIEMRFNSQQSPELYLRHSQAGLPYLQSDHITDFIPPMPVLLLAGEHDEVAPAANSEAIAAAWPHAKMIVIEGAGHLFNIEKPAESNRVILDFLKG